MIKLKDLLTKKKSLKEEFTNKDSNEYRVELVDLIGKPSYETSEEAGWIAPTLPKEYGTYTMNITKVDKVFIIDESIPHSFPADHRDYVYTQYAVPAWQKSKGAHNVEPAMIADFAKVTGSIIIDPLKGTITARCGDLVANDKTIQFVLDVVDGKVQPTKEEYSNRILDKK